MNTLCPLPGRDIDRITRLGPDTSAARLEQDGAAGRAGLSLPWRSRQTVRSHCRSRSSARFQDGLFRRGRSPRDVRAHLALFHLAAGPQSGPRRREPLFERSSAQDLRTPCRTASCTSRGKFDGRLAVGLGLLSVLREQSHEKIVSLVFGRCGARTHDAAFRPQNGNERDAHHRWVVDAAADGHHESVPRLLARAYQNASKTQSSGACLRSRLRRRSGRAEPHARPDLRVRVIASR